MGYDAISVGNLDLAAKYHNSDSSAKQRAPFISANAVDKNGERPFLPYTTVDAGSYKIGITSITAATKGKSEYKTISWEKGLKETLPQMKKSCDFIIVLSNLPTRDNRTIANNYPEINVIISADDKIANLSASLIGSTLITQTGTLGQYIGVLDLELAPNKKWKKGYYTINSLKRKQHSILRKINKLKNDKSGGDNTVRIAELKKLHSEVPMKISQAEKNLVNQTGSSFAVEFVPVETTIEKDPAIESILRTL